MKEGSRRDLPPFDELNLSFYFKIAKPKRESILK